MRLTQFTDYSLRVLVYVATSPTGRASVGEVAQAFGVSHNHLVKVVHRLGLLGYLETLRGKGGGFLLARRAETIHIGDLVSKTEPDFRLAECFGEDGACPVAEAPCGLARALDDARQAFIDHLNRYTLADVTENRGQLVQLLSSAAT